MTKSFQIFGRKGDKLEGMNGVFSSLTLLSARSSTSHTKQSTTKEVGKDIIGTESAMFVDTFL